MKKLKWILKSNFKNYRNGFHLLIRKNYNSMYNYIVSDLKTFKNFSKNKNILNLGGIVW